MPMESNKGRVYIFPSFVYQKQSNKGDDQHYFDVKISSYADKASVATMERVAKAAALDSTKYFSGGDAARKAGMTPLVFSRLAGSITVIIDRETSVNIGGRKRRRKMDGRVKLNWLFFSQVSASSLPARSCTCRASAVKCNVCFFMPEILLVAQDLFLLLTLLAFFFLFPLVSFPVGANRNNKLVWEYSDQTVTSMTELATQFPTLVEAVDRDPNRTTYTPEMLFPPPSDARERLQAVLAFLANVGWLVDRW